MISTTKLSLFTTLRMAFFMLIHQYRMAYRYACGTALLFVFLVPMFLAAQQGGQVITLISEPTAVQAIGRDVRFLRTASHQLGVQEITQDEYANQFQTFSSLYPNLGYTTDVVWLRVHIKNTLPGQTERVLDIGSILLDSVALYEPDEHGNFREYWSGNGIFIEQRTMKTRHPVFTLRLQGYEEKTYYVRAVGSLPMIFHLVLFPHNEFTEQERRDSNFYGCIWGAILCIIALNVMLFFSTRTAIYGYFALHGAASMLALLSLHGIPTEYLWFNIENFNGRILQISISISNLLSILYAQIFLDSRHRRPIVDKIFRVEIVIVLGLITASCFGYGSFMISSLFTLIVVPTIVSLTVMVLHESIGTMRLSLLLYAVAWGLCTMTVMAANIIGLITDINEVWGLRTGAVGAVVQLFIVSIALSLRTSSNQQEVARAQQERIFAEQERAQEVQRNQELSAANEAIRQQTDKLEEQAQSLRIANLEMEQIAQELIQQRTLLQQKNDALNAASAEKNEILNIAAHDLKKPLTGLKGMLEILRSGDDFKPAYLHRMSSTMQQSVDRMFDIVRNLLDVQAIEEGVIKPNAAVFDMVSSVKSLVDTYRLPAAQKRISLELKANASEVLCFADKSLFLQIIDNLVSNAIKYSFPQKHVFVRTLQLKHSTTIADELRQYGVFDVRLLEKFSLEQSLAIAIVQDEGPGFTEADKLRLFQKFARLSAQPTGGEHSTGLGLSIAKRLVESMHGVIWCESSSEEGARFVVAFGASIV